jgi:hypothetical protein
MGVELDLSHTKKKTQIELRGNRVLRGIFGPE